MAVRAGLPTARLRRSDCRAALLVLAVVLAFEVVPSAPAFGQYGSPGYGPPYGAPGYGSQPTYPPQYPSQGYPPQSDQGYPNQGYPPQGYPPQGYPPQSYQQNPRQPSEAETRMRIELLKRSLGFGGIFGPMIAPLARGGGGGGDPCGGYSDAAACNAYKNGDRWAADRLQNHRSNGAERDWYNR